MIHNFGTYFKLYYPGKWRELQKLEENTGWAIQKFSLNSMLQIHSPLISKCTTYCWKVIELDVQNGMKWNDWNNKNRSHLKITELN